MTRPRSFAALTSLAAVTIVAALVLRVYLALVWLRFGVAKLEGGWLTTNPLKPLLTLIGAGQLPSTAAGYAPVARVMVATHADALLSVTIPLTEVAIGIALLAGWRVRTVALVACALNVNLLLSGVANWSLDGRMLVLQLLLVCVLTAARGREHAPAASRALELGSLLAPRSL